MIDLRRWYRGKWALREGGEAARRRDGTARWRLRDRVPSLLPHANLTRHQISEADRQAKRQVEGLRPHKTMTPTPSRVGKSGSGTSVAS